MALIHEGSRCALCRERLGDEPIFATSGVFLPPSDPASSMCDAPIHWRCYAQWSERERFAKALYAAGSPRGNRYWGTAYEDDDVRVTVNPLRPTAAAHVDLAAPSSLRRIRLDDWNAWMAGEPDGAHPLDVAALVAVWPRLRALGDVDAWVARTNVVVPDEDRRLLDHYQAKAAWSRLLHGHVPCPACGTRETRARFVDARTTGGTSSCVCES